jgi:hypothetical protein
MRAMISWSIEPARAQAALAMVKMVSPPSITGLRPKRSESGPKTSMVAAKQIRKPLSVSCASASPTAK